MFSLNRLVMKSHRFITRTIIPILTALPFNIKAACTELEEIFAHPADDHKPLIIWQWMDGLVTKEASHAISRHSRKPDLRECRISRSEDPSR